MHLPIKRIRNGIALVLGAVVIGIYLVLPAGMGIMTILPAREAVGAPPDGYQEITLSTGDGETLSAWYLPPANGTAILLVHGAGGSREGLRPYANMIAQHGFGVLALDLRGHGTSSGKTNRLGWSSTPDISAAVHFLEGREEVKQIGALGLSMGAEVLLGAAAEVPSLKAIVADGATRRCTEELLALPAKRSLFESFTPRVMYAAVEVFSAEKPPKPLLKSMLEAKSTRFLWIAGGAKTLEVDFNRLFAESLASRGSLWVAPDAAHTGAFSRYPREYEQRVMDFFESTLSGGPVK